MAKKEFAFYGKTVEEVKKLTLEEFAKLVPSKERRALLKGFSDRQKKFLLHIRKNPAKLHRTQCRNLVIIPELIGKKIRVYSGKEYQVMEITKEMLGRRLGDFAQTRKRIKHSAPGMGATRSSKFIPLK